MRKIKLSQDSSIVLQEILVNGEEDFSYLSESLRYDKAKLRHILKSLQNRGLVKVRATAGEVWIAVSKRGRRLLINKWRTNATSL